MINQDLHLQKKQDTLGSLKVYPLVVNGLLPSARLSYIDREFIYMYIWETFYCGIKYNAGTFVMGNVQW